MRYFLDEIKQGWDSIHVFRPGIWFFKNPIRGLIVIINRELTYFLRSLFWDFQLILVVIGLSAITVYGFDKLSPSTLEAILVAVAGLLVALLTLFFTAAIFMATLSWGIASKAASASATLLSSLRRVDDNALKECYRHLSGIMDIEEKWTMVNAIAAESVLDQEDYREFREWLRSVQSDFKGTYYEQMVAFPYDVAQSNFNYRAWPITHAVGIIRTKLESSEPGTSQRIHANLNKILDDLEISTTKYEESGAVSYYAQHDLLGNSLARVVNYGLIALVLIGFYKLTSGTLHDAIPAWQLRSEELLRFSTIACTLIALTLAVRYLLRFVNYFKWSVPEYRSPAYIGYDDPSETNPNAYEGK